MKSFGGWDGVWKIAFEWFLSTESILFFMHLELSGRNFLPGESSIVIEEMYNKTRCQLTCFTVLKQYRAEILEQSSKH